MKKTIYTISAVLIATLPLLLGNATTKVDSCTQSNEKAKRTLQYFLSLEDEDLSAFRVESGTNGIPITEIAVVNDISICSQIQATINNNSDLQEDESKFEKCFYKTNDFLFIIYPSKELRLGYTTLIVLDSSYQVKGIYAI